MPIKQSKIKNTYKVQVVVITNENNLSTFLRLRDALITLPCVVDVVRIKTRIN